MDLSTFNTLRNRVNAENISYGELADIDAEFEKIDPATLNDRPENAMASDKLDEIEARIPYATQTHYTDDGQGYLYDPRVVKEGARIVSTTKVYTREPGDDSGSEVTVEPGCVGTVEGYVEEWFHLDVKLDDGRQVWLSPDEVGVVERTRRTVVLTLDVERGPHDVDDTIAEFGAALTNWVNDSWGSPDSSIKTNGMLTVDVYDKDKEVSL